MRRRGLAVGLAVLALLAAVRPARAEMGAAEHEARRRFDEAEISYRGGRYAEAVIKYQAGYAAMPLPGFLVNIAQCQRRLGDLKTARATYREFVLVAPDSRLVPEVQTLIHQLDVLIADLASGGAGASAGSVGDGVDIHASDPTGPAAPLSLSAPPPAADPALLAAPADAPAAHHSRTRWWLWGGVAAAAVAAGVIAGLALASSGTTTVHSGTLGTFSR